MLCDRIMTGRLTYDQTKPGTSEGLAAAHISCFRSVRRIYPRVPDIDRLNKIVEMLRRNRSDIEDLNFYMTDTDPNSFVNLFGKASDFAQKIYWKYRVRDRLESMYYKELKKLSNL